MLKTLLDNAIHEPVKAAGDAAGIGLVIGAWTDYLPTIAAALSAVWFALRIVESLQTIYRNHKEHRDGK